MITVNPIFIDLVLNPLVGGADSETVIFLYGNYKTDIEKEVKQLATEVLLPEFLSRKEIMRMAIKHSLAFYLNFPQKVDFESIFDASLLPLETPKNSFLFFRWIWEVFFNYEDFKYILSATIVENFDVEAPLHVPYGLENYNSPLERRAGDERLPRTDEL